LDIPFEKSYALPNEAWILLDDKNFMVSNPF